MPDSPRDERFLHTSVVVVVAHPDDETIGLSVQLARFAQQCTVIHATDGSPRPGEDAQALGFATVADYAAARRRELLDAMAVVGVPAEQCLELGYADQEASLDMAGLARKLHALFRQMQPKFVFTHAYEGGHPDHDALAFAVPLAARLVQEDGGMPPGVLEFAGYNAGETGIRTFTFVEQPGVVENTIELNAAERARKQRMYECYRSQQHILQQFPLFLERHRPAPAYDFTRPPHDGQLYYERYSWGMDGSRWRELAAQAKTELGA